MLTDWVGLTLIWVLNQLPRRFFQIPISPGRIGQTVEIQVNPNPVHEQKRHPVHL